MFDTNPFFDLQGFISPAIMQLYVIAMVILVVGGTILDMMHKKSAQYFFENSKAAEKAATRTVSSSEKTSLLVKTVTSEVLTSSEFQNPKRRMSHLFTMYGFIVFVISTAVLIFGYAESESAGIWPVLWHLGALSLCFGGYWFWFFIRVDVYSEGVTYFRFVQADLFIVSLLMTCTFALLWSFASGSLLGWLFFAIFVISSTVLFGSVLWSKFAHMFFKPAAAYQKKITKADGSLEKLPEIPDLAAPATKERFPDIPEYMGDNPGYMGMGIKREPPGHY